MLRTLAEKVDPRHTALLVIDMQNDFCHEKGAAGSRGGDVSGFQAVVGPLNRLIGEARRAGVAVLFIRVCRNEWTMSDVWMERHQTKAVPCREGTWGAEWYGVAPEAGDPVINKQRHSAFFKTNLDLILRSRGIRTVIGTGVALGGCVEGTLRDAFMHDYYVVCAADCCGAGNKLDGERVLRWIDHGLGVVASSDEIARAWQKQRLAAASAQTLPV